MNKKEEFLKRLSNEELEFIGSITHTELMREIESRKPKVEHVDICGNYYYRKAYGGLYLIQVIKLDGDDWYEVKEISIEGNEVVDYEASYEYEDLINYKPLDPKIYNLVMSKIKERDDTLDIFNNQIREIIETLKS